MWYLKITIKFREKTAKYKILFFFVASFCHSSRHSMAFLEVSGIFKMWINFDDSMNFCNKQKTTTFVDRDIVALFQHVPDTYVFPVTSMLAQISVCYADTQMVSRTCKHKLMCKKSKSLGRYKNNSDVIELIVVWHI